ncbi:MAG: hypothetical protein M3P96_10800 [Actinomycetota bacterium]|nr:hypothetical protein [Actinomycetota bacterium]
MDVHDKLDELTAAIENARAMPMSGACIVNRAEVLALLDDLRELLPEEFRHAELLLREREAVVEEGRREAEGLLEEARAERERLLEQSEVIVEARQRAEETEARAEEAAAALREDADGYVDDKLAEFEAVLHRTLATVARGRRKLRTGEDDDVLDPAAEQHATGRRVGPGRIDVRGYAATYEGGRQPRP